MYQTPFCLTEPVGNNAFSYEKRTNKSLFVPSVIDGTFSDVRQGTETVFEDFDENDTLRSCTGLRNFVRMEWNGIPMVVFDNHNHALYFWYEAYAKGMIGRGSTLVHIDEHSDLWGNENSLSFNESAEIWKNNRIWVQIEHRSEPYESLYGEWGSGDLSSKSEVISYLLGKVFHFTNYGCTVGNYIQPALREGLIGKVLRIEDTIGMGKYASYEKEAQESLILNLDLDFFAPELDYIPFEGKKRTILHFARQAQLITVATSPFFIDQARAIAMLGSVFGFEDI